MAEDDSDFQDVLEGTVDEAKDKIRNLEDPDYEGLLKAEKEGKNRKTLKEFIESQMDSGETDEEEEIDTEEVVTEIEEETSGGVMGSYSRTSVLAGGLILGLLLGFVAANYSTPASTGGQAPPDVVKDSVRTLAGLGSNATVEVTDPVRKHSMYNMNITSTVQTENGTRSSTQEVYVTLDGEYLFLVQRRFGQMLRPIDISNTIQRARAQAAPSPDTGQTGNSTQ